MKRKTFPFCSLYGKFLIYLQLKPNEDKNEKEFDAVDGASGRPVHHSPE
jgi:hypothetical protein